jgi:protein ImuA
MQAVFPFRQATDLVSIRERLVARFGQINLDFLKQESVDEALNFSSLRARAFVVDTHVLRILRRFGFVGLRADAKAAYNAVMAAADGLDADDLFELHWQMRGLGQTICTPAKASCSACPLSDICQRRTENLTTLKASLEKPGLEETSVRTPLGHADADLCLRGGLQHGVLHEVFAVIGHEAPATGFAAGLVARIAADKQSLWIRQDFSGHEFGELSATGLLEFGLDPARLLLLSVVNTSDGLRAANDALSCAALGAVVIEIPGNPKVLDLVASRRLTLAAAQKSVTAFLLRFGAQPDSSTAETRWLVRAATSPKGEEDWGYPFFEADLVRNRHGKTGHWFMKWNCDECVFQNATTDHRAMVSASAN